MKKVKELLEEALKTEEPFNWVVIVNHKGEIVREGRPYDITDYYRKRVKDYEVFFGNDIDDNELWIEV